MLVWQEIPSIQQRCHKHKHHHAPQNHKKTCICSGLWHQVLFWIFLFTSYHKQQQMNLVLSLSSHSLWTNFLGEFINIGANFQVIILHPFPVQWCHQYGWFTVVIGTEFRGRKGRVVRRYPANTGRSCPPCTELHTGRAHSFCVRWRILQLLVYFLWQKNRVIQVRFCGLHVAGWGTVICTAAKQNIVVIRTTLIWSEQILLCW